MTFAWHAMEPVEVLDRLGAREDGLAGDEADRRLAEHGPNELPESGAAPLWRIVLTQFASPLIYVLLAAAAVSVVVGEPVDAAFIALVLLVNAGVGAWQESGAERSAAALRDLLEVRARARRDGRWLDIPAEALVPGDVVALGSGDRVPADARLLDAAGLRVEESALTGESAAADKDPQADAPPDAALGDRTGMVFAGTLVQTGRAEAVVVETGTRTELGRIAEAAGSQRGGAAPLVVRMERFTRQVALATLLGAAVYGGIALAQGEDLVQVFFLAVALVVSAIPEGLPVALTSTLAIGARRMAARGVIVRGTNAVEGLGSTTVVASDKTGTLTVDRQTVRALALPPVAPGESWSRHEVTGPGDAGEGSVEPVPAPPGRLSSLVVAGALANEAELVRRDSGWISRGDAVDVAFLALAAKAGVEPAELRDRVTHVGAIDYESHRGYSAARIHPGDLRLGREWDAGDPGGTVVAVKGSVEAVLPFVDGPGAIDDRAVHDQVQAMAGEGLRVLAVAAGAGPHRDQHPDGLHEDHLEGLTLLGLVGMIDPLRPQAAAAVATARSAGVRVVMVTGDHPATATAIARRLGLVEGDGRDGDADRAVKGAADGAADSTAVVVGSDLARLVHPDDDPDGARAAATPGFVAAVRHGCVFARVAPLQKLQIVKAMQADGEFAAVTGDGVNDAPALRAANIGVAMGSGTDAAKGVADLIVTDDDFASIVAGIEQGRHAYANVRKVIWLLVATGLAEILLFLVAQAIGLPAPLLAVQLLWLNIVTNGIQGVALAFEGGEPGVMQRPPRPPSQPLFDRLMISETVTAALVMAAGGLAVWWWALEVAGLPEGESRNLVLLVMVLFENVHAFNARSETASAFRVPLRRNPFLVVGVAGALSIHIAALFLPPIQGVLGTMPVPLDVAGVLVGVALALLVVVEVAKAVERRREGTMAV